MKPRKFWLIVISLIVVVVIVLNTIHQIQSHKGFHFQWIYLAALLAIIATWAATRKTSN